MATFNPSLFESYDDYMSIMDSIGMPQQASTQVSKSNKPNLSYFGREGGWGLGAGAFVDPSRGRVFEPPSGVVFQRGNEVVVGDEIYWSPYAPVGDKLKQMVADNKSKGYRVGTVVSPYATLVGSEEGKGAKVGIKELAAEIARSGVDFVAIDPYIGWFGLKTPELVNWSKDFLQEMQALGKDTILVVQNDVPTSETSESEVIAHNKALMDLPGFSEYVAYSEAPEGSRLYDFFNEYYQEPQAPAQESPKAAAPTEPERRTAQEAPPASQQQESPPSASVAAAQGGLTGQQSGVSQSIADRLMAMPRNEFETVGFQEGGKDYSMDPNGLISVRDIGAKPNDQVQVFDQAGNLLATHAVEQRSDFVQALNQAARVGIPAVIGASLLGPAGFKLLSAPAAAAVGSGGSTLLQGGSVEDALKAAALAGLGAYGTQGLMSSLNNSAYDLSFAAADAAQLANQGLDAAAIAQNLSTYVDPTIASSLANTAANQAFALADATQLAQQGIKTDQIVQVLQASGVDATTAANMAGLAVDSVANPVIDASGKVVPPTINATDIVPDLKFQPQTRNPVQISTLPDSVTVTGQGVTGDLFNIPATSVGGLLSAANLPTLPEILQAATQQVQVAGQNQAAQTTAPEAVGGALAGVTPQVPTQQATTQQLQVTGQTAANNVDLDTASTMLSSLLGQPVTVQGATQRLDITGQNIGQTITPEVAASLLSAAAGQSVSVTGQNIPKTESTASTVGNIISAITPSVPSGAEQVEVTGRRDTSLLPQLGGAVTAALPGVPAGFTSELPKPLEPAQKTTDQSLFKPSDVLKLIGLLGGAGAGSALAGAGGGVGMGGVPPSDTMIGTTTPQFGNDYYAAIQRYYNTYMPQTPRNVATPLQQWYENKFGA